MCVYFTYQIMRIHADMCMTKSNIFSILRIYSLSRHALSRQWSVNAGEQMAERSDVPETLNHNVGGVIADHTPNLTQQRPRGFIDKSWEDGGKTPEYWVRWTCSVM